MKIKTTLCATLIAALFAGFLATPAVAKDKLEGKAKISKAAAMKTALAKVPGGKVKESDLEEENGKLIWSFDIATKGSKDITEVAVDATTGEIVAVDRETPAEQAKENLTDAAERDGKMSMNKVPTAVQQALKAYATEAEIKGVEESDVNGTKVIEFDIVKNGKASEIAFRPNGKLFSTEEEVTLTDLPAAVQKTIAERSTGAKAGKPEKVVQEGKTSYEIVIEKDGKKHEYTISSKGKITDKEEVGKE